MQNEGQEIIIFVKSVAMSTKLLYNFGHKVTWNTQVFLVYQLIQCYKEYMDFLMTGYIASYWQ